MALHETQSTRDLSDPHHVPSLVRDLNGGTSYYGYNTRGQVVTSTNAAGDSMHQGRALRMGCATTRWEPLEYLSKGQGDSLAELALRVFVETEHEERAVGVVSLLTASGFPGLRVKKVETRPYWKMPEYYEVLVVAEAGVDERRSFLPAQRLATGWTSIGENDVIWDGSSGRFLSPDVRWAQLEVVES